MNVLNSGKRDYMRCLSSIVSLFRNEFDKLNNTGAQMLDPIYRMTLTLLKAALSVTFDLLILKIMFLFYKNTVKILKFR